MTQPPGSSPLLNLIGVPDPDVPIYRIFSWRYLRQALIEHKMALVSPSSWDDPYENLIAMSGITYTNETPYRQEFFDKARRQVFGQCWTITPESDAMWRIYSTVSKDARTNRSTDPSVEGVRVRTTPRKLRASLLAWCPTTHFDDSCFLGRVEYLPESSLLQQITNLVAKEGIQAFAGGRGHADALLVKRDAFAHEQEVRLVYVEPDEPEPEVPSPIRFMDIDPSELFEELILDPRLGADDVADRTEEIRSNGYDGRVDKSLLYQRVLLDIHV